MAAGAPGALRLAFAGLRRARRSLPLALLLWVSQLALALVAIAPLAAGLHRLTVDRPAADALLGRPPFDLLAQLLRGGGELFPSVGPALCAAALLALLANAALSGGILETLLADDDRPLLHRFGRGAGRFLGRMLRAGAIAAPVALLLAALGSLPWFAASKRLAENDREVAGLALRAGGILIAGLLLLIVLLALDLARVRMVRDDRRDAFRLLRTSLWKVLRHPLRFVGAWLVLALVSVALLALYAVLAPLLPAGALFGIVALTLLQQLLLIARAALRVALWSVEIDLADAFAPALSHATLASGTPEAEPDLDAPVAAETPPNESA